MKLTDIFLFYEDLKTSTKVKNNYVSWLFFAFFKACSKGMLKSSQPVLIPKILSINRILFFIYFLMSFLIRLRTVGIPIVLSLLYQLIFKKDFYLLSIIYYTGRIFAIFKCDCMFKIMVYDSQYKIFRTSKTKPDIFDSYYKMFIYRYFL